MKVVLVRPPFYALFGVTTPKMKTYPLNLLYLATFLRERSDHQAALVDGENVSVPGLRPPELQGVDPGIIMHEGSARMVAILEDPDHPLWVEIERRILAHGPDLVGMTCNSGNMDTVQLLVKRLKRLDMPVVLGGSHPTVLPEQSMRYTSADMAAIGEGELTLVRLMDSLEGTRERSTIPSLAWQENGRITVNPRGDLIPDINELPIPDRSFIDRADYFGEVIMTGRGCPFDCAYCASRNIWGRKVRLRSVDSVIGELELLKGEAESEASGRAGSGFAAGERPGR